MKTSILSALVFITLFILPMIAAETEQIKLYEVTDLKFTCTLNDAVPSASTRYNITVSYPNGSIFINNQVATPQGNGIFNYTTRFTVAGMYKVQMACYDGTYSFAEEGYYNVTPTGMQANSFFNNPVLLILGLIGLILLIAGVSMNIPWFGFIGAIMFMLVGIYTMIYGFDGFNNLYTQSAALVFIGIAIVFMFLAVYEWLDGLGEDSIVYGGEEDYA